MIATLSYAIYSVAQDHHSLHAKFAGKSVGLDKNSNLTMLMCVVSIIMGALLMRYVIEKPALALRNNILSQVE